ncbi:hypothetical protein BN2537_655 [Streptomyces venezuelae]|nr:hypothetical protein BN2537_655 [Streptomyces venezuelae]
MHLDASLTRPARSVVDALLTLARPVRTTGGTPHPAAAQEYRHGHHT